jgi:hypothetical protein
VESSTWKAARGGQHVEVDFWKAAHGGQHVEMNMWRVGHGGQLVKGTWMAACVELMGATHGKQHVNRLGKADVREWVDLLIFVQPSSGSFCC